MSCFLLKHIGPVAGGVEDMACNGLTTGELDSSLSARTSSAILASKIVAS